jgi:hypothetical protein
MAAAWRSLCQNHAQFVQDFLSELMFHRADAAGLVLQAGCGWRLRVFTERFPTLP